jgi:DNA-directed RNA polymerase specialized sigma24 family protein
MSIDLITLHKLRALALRLSRNADDSSDAVQETLLASIQNNRFDMPWLNGVLQKQVAMQIRAKIRRRRREEIIIDEAESVDIEASSPSHHVFMLIRNLPKALRQVVVLALHGLNAEEIRYLLGIAPTAFRQRLTAIRKSLGKLSEQQSREALAIAYVREPKRSVELQLGLIRRALKAALHGGQCIGTHDLDGHLMIIRREAHTSAWRGN